MVVNTSSNPSVSLITWGLILSQLGFYPLLSATTSFMRKWYYDHDLRTDYRERIWKPFDSRLSRFDIPHHLFHLFVLGGLVCSILGGVWSSPTDPNINTGYTLRRVGAIIFMVSVIILINFVILMRRSSVNREQRTDPLLTQIFLVLPIMLVRIIYATVQSFKSTPQSPGHNTWVYLVLLLIPDFISDSIYTFYGAMLVRMSRRVDFSAGELQRQKP